MFKFFRKIRQRLLRAGNFRKYFVYAVGEIFLVVIGILIALQVNNWNEKKKEADLEINTLSEIYMSLEADLKNIYQVKESMERKIKNCELVLQYLEACLPFDEKVSSALGSYHSLVKISYNFSGYKLLEDRGIDLVKNDSIRRSISNHYETEIPGLKDTEQGIEQEMINFRAWKQHFVYILPNTAGMTVAYNYESLCLDKEFIGRLKGKLAVFNFYTKIVLGSAVSSTEGMLSILGAELQRLQ